MILIDFFFVILQACQLAHDLELHESFTIFDFVFPLVLQDKINTAEPYLEEAKSLQLPLIELLDSLLDRSSSIVSLCDPYITWVNRNFFSSFSLVFHWIVFQIRIQKHIFIQRKKLNFWFSHSKYDYDYRDLCVQRLQPKTLSKLIKRLAKQYNIPDDVIPNVTKGKVRGQLQFLIRKNYSEKSLSKDAWREMVLEIVPKTAEQNLKLELIDGCSYNNDMNEAIYWAR